MHITSHVLGLKRIGDPPPPPPKKKKLSEPARQQLGRQKSRQQAEHAKAYHDLPVAQQRKVLIALGSRH